MPVLIIAVEQELPIVVQLLLSKGADPIAMYTDEAGVERAGVDSALKVALQGNRPYITRILTERTSSAISLTEVSSYRRESSKRTLLAARRSRRQHGAFSCRSTRAWRPISS